MPVVFLEEQRIFHLYHPNVSLLLSIETLPDGSDTVLMRHFGAPVSPACLDDAELQRDRWISFDTYRAAFPFALPTAGHGDFRPAQLSVQGQDGSNCTLMQYRRHEITAGKRLLEGLPATYAEQDGEATTLALFFEDPYTGAQARLEYTLFEETGAIAIQCLVTNGGSQLLTLTKAASAALTLPGAYELLHLHGAWARECTPERLPPMHGERVIRSRRGASSHQHNPFAVLLTPGTDEHQGEAYGVSLVYSGNFVIDVEQDELDQTRLVAGINDEDFSWLLAPGETFQTPEAVVIYSGQGLGDLSQRYHRLYRTRLCRGYWRDRPRPILFNNWEATYFDFTQEKLLQIARRAADLGAELFVLDDGWFGHRNDDTTSLGDWFEDPAKLPQGLGSLSDQIHALGLQFGLWFEPEMISRDSQLYRTHPDWLMHAANRPVTPSRSQYILDMSRTDVQEYLIRTVSDVLERGHIDYVKWDMNRHFSEIGSARLSPSRQPGLAHRYMLGVYRVMEELTTRHPTVLFEGCSGGGGRLDPGMLYYMPQIWVSDNSDAVARMSIQYGASLVYPPSTLCCHVSAVPNHQVRRVTSMDLRGMVAMSGVLGYQLDPTALAENEQTAIRAQIEQYKALRPLVARGTFTRLQSPVDHNLCAWQICCDGHVLVWAFQVLQIANRLPPRLRLQGLPAGHYRNEADGRVYTAEDLCGHGLSLPFTRPHDQEAGDFCGCLLHFVSVPTSEHLPHNQIQLLS